jgi:hypothetical protein
LPPEASEHLEPNLSAQDAVDEQVINRLRGLAAEHAIIKICEAVPLALLRSPTSVLDHEPKEEFVLTWRPHPLYLLCSAQCCLSVVESSIC